MSARECRGFSDPWTKGPHPQLLGIFLLGEGWDLRTLVCAILWTCRSACTSGARDEAGQIIITARRIREVNAAARLISQCIRAGARRCFNTRTSGTFYRHRRSNFRTCSRGQWATYSPGRYKNYRRIDPLEFLSRQERSISLRDVAAGTSIGIGL